MPGKIVPIDEGYSSLDEQSRSIRREVERLMFLERYEDGYDLYLTDPLLNTTDADDFDTFVSNNS